MIKFARGILAVAALFGSGAYANAQATDPSVEFAFMPRTMDVILLNEGGKYVAVDFEAHPAGRSVSNG